MATPYDRKILLVYWKSSTLPGLSIREVATRIKQTMPNVAGIMLKAVNGTRWQEQGNTADEKAISSRQRIADWVDEFDRHGLEIHVWGVPRAKTPEDITAEANRYIRCAEVPGVKSILLDVEHGQYYWQGTAEQATELMHEIRVGIPNNMHIGMILDGRRNRSFSVYVDPFIPFVDSLHPMVYPILFGDYQSISAHLDEAFSNLAIYNKPIVPMLQAFTEGSRRPTPDEITQQAHLSFSKGGVGVSYFRMGDDRASDAQAHMGAAEMTAIATVELPPGPGEAGQPPVSYTWQDVINASVAVAARNDAVWQEWFNASGLGLLWHESLRNQPYSGPPIMEWPAPDPVHRQEIAQLVEMGSDEIIRIMREALAEAEARREARVRERRQVQGSIIGIHGAPGPAAPPVDMWDRWITYLKDMGVHWYKQCDLGDPNDLGEGSIFQWALRLQREGITPVIRYQQPNQFPDRLPGHYFEKMKHYSNEGVVWAEIGNEPNLDCEWKGDWQPIPGPDGNMLFKMSHTNPEVIRIIADVWVADAEAAIAAGVKPAFYAFAPTDWRGGSHPHYSSVFFTRKVVQYLADNHCHRTLNIFNNGGWIAVHAATYENACDFDPFAGAVVWDMTLRGYEVVLQAFRDYFGNNLDTDRLVIMATEGGCFTPESNSMLGHPPLHTDEEHAARVIEMFKWLEAHSPLQAMMPWCLSVGDRIGHYYEPFKNDGWIKQVNGELVPRPVIDAMHHLHLEYGHAGGG